MLKETRGTCTFRYMVCNLCSNRAMFLSLIIIDVCFLKVWLYVLLCVVTDKHCYRYG